MASCRTRARCRTRVSYRDDRPPRHVRPEPIPAAIPVSERGRFEVALEPGQPGQVRLWMYGDGGQGRPRSILLTLGDVRGLCMFLAATPR